VNPPAQVNPPGRANPAANPPEAQVDAGDRIFRQENVFVTAPVIVHDSRGNIVNGLAPLDFELYDNSKLQKITEDSTSRPIRTRFRPPSRKSRSAAPPTT